MKRAESEGGPADRVPLTETELRDAEGRIRAARRLAKKIGLSEGSELGRLVAEVRSWRRKYAPRKLSPAKEGKRAALMRSIKADAAAGRRVTLITLSVADMEQTAAGLTEEELRHVRFDIPGLCKVRVGRSWQSLTPTQRAAVLGIFTDTGPTEVAAQCGVNMNSIFAARKSALARIDNPAAFRAAKRKGTA